MLYFYSAENSDQQLVQGTVEAPDAQTARQALLNMDLTPRELHVATLQEKKAAEDGTVQFPGTLSTPNLVLEGEIEQTPVENPPAKEQSANKSVQEKVSKKRKKRAPKKKYHPFADTIRLYAGWLLAWYCIVYMLGGYQYTRSLPFRIPYVEALLPPFSPIVLSFTLAAFLFLLCTSLHKTLGGGKIAGMSLSALGIVAFVLYRMNV